MFRKLALAAAAAVTLGAGMAAAPAPAAAQGFGFYFGSPGYHHYHRPHYGYWGHPYRPRAYYYDHGPRRHCERVVVRKKVRGEWRRIVERRCYRGGRW
jgi:hypothetical protein